MKIIFPNHLLFIIPFPIMRALKFNAGESWRVTGIDMNNARLTTAMPRPAINRGGLIAPIAGWQGQVIALASTVSGHESCYLSKPFANDGSSSGRGMT